MRKTLEKGCLVIFVSLFSLIGVVMVGMGINQFIEYRQLGEDGVVVTGRMIDHYFSTSDDSTTYYMVYEFAAADDRIYRDEQAVKKEIYDDFERGGSIQIEYDADNPTLSKVAGTNSIWTPLGVFCFGMCWSSIVLMFWGSWAYGKVKRV
jgi:hypothetical protein